MAIDFDLLDPNQDYSGIDKLYPVIRFATYNSRDICNPLAFAKHCLAALGITNADLSTDLDTLGDGSNYVEFVYRDAGWTWVEQGHTDPKAEVIHYTFGGALGHNNHPLVPFVVGTEDAI